MCSVVPCPLFACARENKESLTFFLLVEEAHRVKEAEERENKHLNHYWKKKPTQPAPLPPTPPPRPPPCQILQGRRGLEETGCKTSGESTNAGVDSYKGSPSPSVERELQWIPHRTRRVPGRLCPGTVAAFSGFQLLRNMWKLHAVSQLNKWGGKMAESEKVDY